jgi:hypothetical protein
MITNMKLLAIKRGSKYNYKIQTKIIKNGLFLIKITNMKFCR